jgi:hypothetical protein
MNKLKKKAIVLEDTKDKQVDFLHSTTNHKQKSVKID